MSDEKMSMASFPIFTQKISKKHKKVPFAKCKQSNKTK